MPMIAVAVLAALLGVAAIGTVIWMWWGPKVRYQMRVAAVTRSTAQTPAGARVEKAQRIQIRDQSSAVAHLLAGVPWFERLQLEILGAGWLLRPSEFVYICCGAALGTAILMLLLTRTPFLGFLGLAGFFIPWAIMKSKQAARSKALSSQIPDALDMLCSALRSGFAISRGMQLVQTQMHPPIAEEFGRVLDEVQYGISLPEALDGIVLRTQNYDMELLVSAVQTQLELGGNLGEVLGNISGMVRERVKLAGEIAAATAEGRLSAGILLLMPFVMALLINLINPGYLAPLLHTELGLMLIGAGLFLMIIGGLMLKKLITIEI